MYDTQDVNVFWIKFFWILNAKQTCDIMNLNGSLKLFLPVIIMGEFVVGRTVVGGNESRKHAFSEKICLNYCLF